jgi:hypothetical protein
MEGQWLDTVLVRSIEELRKIPPEPKLRRRVYTHLFWTKRMRGLSLGGTSQGWTLANVTAGSAPIAATPCKRPESFHYAFTP